MRFTYKIDKKTKQNFRVQEMGNGQSSTDVHMISDEQLLKNVDNNQAKLIGPALTPQNNRFLRTLRCRRGGDVNLTTVKVFFVKNVDLSSFREKLKVQKILITQDSAPNVLSYQRFREGGGSSFAFVSRQYIFANLKDRISTRPFLSESEKLWIAYSILNAGLQLHNLGLGHGDIKSENVLLTSWGWVVLTDLAPFKPTFMQADQSAAPFNYFFSTGKTRCYIAPERFSPSVTSAAARSSKDSAEKRFIQQMGSKDVDARKASNTLAEAIDVRKADEDEKNAQMAYTTWILKAQPADSNPIWRKDNSGLLPSMDIFSAGCVLAELFNSDTQYTFELPDLLSYASKGESSRLKAILEKIVQPELRSMVESMTKHDPASRLSFSEYLKSPIFPKYFPFLYSFMKSFLNETSVEDALVWRTCEKYGEIVEQLLDVKDIQGEDFFRKIFQRKCMQEEFLKVNESNSSQELPDADDLSFESLDQMIRELETKVSQISTLPNRPDKIEKKEDRDFDQRDFSSEWLSQGKDALNIIINYLSFCLQSASQPNSRVLSILLLKRFCLINKNDEVFLSRVLPFLVDRLSNDSSPWVRCTTLQTLTDLLESVKEIPLSEVKLFPDFLISSLNECSRDSSEAVRVTFSSCLPRIALAAKAFLEITRQTHDSPLPYDFELSTLHDAMQKMIDRTVATDSINSADLAVKNTLVQHVMKLCLFFGRDRIERWLLPWLLSVVNVNIKGVANWRLQIAVLKALPSIGACVGSEAYDFSPLIDEMLSNANGQDLVVEAAANCFTSLTSLGLIQKMKMLRLGERITPLTRHPSVRVRKASIQLLATIAYRLSLVESAVEVQTYIAEKLTPHLKSSHRRLILLLGRNGSTIAENSILLEECIQPSYTNLKNWADDFNKKLSTKPPTFNSSNIIFASPKMLQQQEKDFKGVIRVHTLKTKEEVINPKTHESYVDFKTISSKYGIINQEHIPGKVLLRRAQGLDLPLMKLYLGRTSSQHTSNFNEVTANDWKPKRVLITSLHEHSGSVNRIAVSDDYSCFVTASDDGFAKFWLTKNLDRNPCLRATITFDAKGRAVDACSIKNSSSFAVCSDTGKIHLIRMEAKSIHETKQYFPRELKSDNMRIAALGCTSTNYLHAATEKGPVLGWDLRSARLNEMPLVLGFGSVSCMAISTDGDWLCLGTHRGVIAVFDLRFNFLVTALRHPRSCAIHRLYCSKSTEGLPYVFVAAGPNQAMMLNIETGETRYAFACAIPEYCADKVKLGGWKSSQEELFTEKFDKISLNQRQLDRYVNEAKFFSSSHHPSPFSSPHHSIRAILCPCDISSGGNYRGEPPSVLTAGTDMIVRYWDCQSISSSALITAPSDEPKIKFEAKQLPNKNHLFFSLSQLPQPSSTSKTKARFALRPAHTDAILDLAAIRLDISPPHNPFALISAGRDSVVRIWQ